METRFDSSENNSTLGLLLRDSSPSTASTLSIGGGSEESHFEARNLEIIEGGNSRATDQPEATAVTLDLDTTTSVI